MAACRVPETLGAWLREFWEYPGHDLAPANFTITVRGGAAGPPSG